MVEICILANASQRSDIWQNIVQSVAIFCIFDGDEKFAAEFCIICGMKSLMPSASTFPRGMDTDY